MVPGPCTIVSIHDSPRVLTGPLRAALTPSRVTLVWPYQPSSPPLVQVRVGSSVTSPRGSPKIALMLWDIRSWAVEGLLVLVVTLVWVRKGPRQATNCHPLPGVP